MSSAPALARFSLALTSEEYEFRELAERFCAMAGAVGVRLLPYTEGSLNKFRGLSEDQRILKLAGFKTYFECCERATRAGVGLNDGIGLLKSVLADLGLRVSAETLSYLSDEDVIEVYRCDLTQLFRNLRFLEICSYPLMDLYVNEWPELYRRPHVLTQAIIDEFLQLRASGSDRPLMSRLPEHFLEEIFSPGRHKFYIRQKILAPILDQDNQMVGVVSSLRANLLKESEANYSNVKPLSL
jgi:hypothetical protein